MQACIQCMLFIRPIEDGGVIDDCDDGGGGGGGGSVEDGTGLCYSSDDSDGSECDEYDSDGDM